MAHLSTTSDIYNQLLLRSPVCLKVPSETAYHNLRTMLIRKFRLAEKEFETLGLDWPYADEFLKCSLNRESMEATMMLAPKSERKTRAQRWEIKEI